MNYSLLNEADRTIVQLIGDMDIEATEFIEDELYPSVHSFSNLEFRMSQVPFVDSTGIGLLIRMVQALQELGKQVVITGIRSDVLVVFLLLNIPDILGRHVFPELDSA